MKGLILDVFESASYARTRARSNPSVVNVAGGLRSITLVGVERRGVLTPLPRDAQVFEASPERPAFKLVVRTFGPSGETLSLVPVEAPRDMVGRDMVGPMMGGAYAASSDSRFSEAAVGGFYGAVAVHDRYESARQYTLNAD